jgi:hypothetical protein
LLDVPLLFLYLFQLSARREFVIAFNFPALALFPRPLRRSSTTFSRVAPAAKSESRRYRGAPRRLTRV